MYRPFLRRLPIGLMALLLGLAAGLPRDAVAAPDGLVIDATWSAHWYPPERSGEGWTLEILDAQRALLYWFTYDEEGKQRWLTAGGTIAGDRIDFPELVVTYGGRFGPDFDPDDVVREVVGDASLRFTDCNNGTIDYRAFGEEQVFAIRRLTNTVQLECEGPRNPDTVGHAGQSGSWYDPSHSGEGYTLQWLSPGEVAIVTWYSYDSDGDQYWMQGLGELRDGAIRFPDMYATRGARFGSGFDPDDVERFPWGALELRLDCDAGSAHYDSVLPEFASGDLDLVRLTQLHELDCAVAEPPDLGLATWSVRGSVGPALSEWPAVTLGDAIYVGGGLRTLFTNSAEFWRYEPAPDRWTRLADLPAARDHGMMAVLDGSIYFFGGYSQAISSPSASAWRYDPSNGQWSSIADMPVVRAAGGAAALEGKLYVSDGVSLSIYDPDQNAWQLLADDAIGQRDHSAMVAYRGEIWILGGRNHRTGVANGSSAIFDPATGTTRQGPFMNFARSGFGASVVADQIVVIGGESISPLRIITSAEAYSPVDDAWHVIASPPIDMHGAGAATFDGDVYLMPGSVRAGSVSNPGRVQVLMCRMTKPRGETPPRTSVRIEFLPQYPQPHQTRVVAPRRPSCVQRKTQYHRQVDQQRDQCRPHE